MEPWCQLIDLTQNRSDPVVTVTYKGILVVAGNMANKPNGHLAAYYWMSEAMRDGSIPSPRQSWLRQVIPTDLPKLACTFKVAQINGVK